MSSGDSVAIIIAVIASAGASSGFWAWVMRRDSKRSASTQLLLGIAHERIVYLGEIYIARGSVTSDEFESFDKYLYQPYSTFGGNGLAEKIHSDVRELPIVTSKSHTRSAHVSVKYNDEEIFSEVPPI